MFCLVFFAIVGKLWKHMCNYYAFKRYGTMIDDGCVNKKDGQVRK